MATPTTLPATAVAGEVLTASYVNALRGAFRILQVVSGGNSTAVTTTSATYVTTNVSATITPSSTSSKILAFYTGAFGGSNNSSEINSALYRGTVPAGTILTVTTMYANAASFYGNMSQVVLDSPNTTSATTYTIGFHPGGGASTATAKQNNTNLTLVLLEVSA
jgi:hypothetical protein